MTEKYTAATLLTIAHEGLRDIGYRNELLQEKYEFADMFAQDQPTRAIDLAAFAQEPPSYRNACIGIAVPSSDSSESVAQYQALGAPQILTLHPGSEKVLRWKMLAQRKPELIEVIDPLYLSNVIRAHRAEWNPDRVLRAKSIRFRNEAVQLDFFDFGLLPMLEEVVYEKLDSLLQDVIAACKAVYLEHHKTELDYGALFRLIFRFVAAKLLGDRQYPGNWLSGNAQEVIEAVEAFYFQHLPSEAALNDTRVQNIAWQKIRTAFSFRNLSVEALAYVYENTFVSPETRKAYGTHATPPEIAEYIVQSLPFEELPLNERHVFEPFCGHAPFLTAALGRLRGLLPSDVDTKEKHEHFVQMLSGMEIDAFAREVARYSLILADYPNPNGWRIENANVFTSPQLTEYVSQAQVVLCNPPYEDFDPRERQLYSSIRSANKAVEALRRVLEHSPRMLGFVLPRIFASGQSYREIRKQLASRYNNIMLVELPDTAFNYSDAETTLVIAHGQHNTSPLWRSVSVQKKDYTRFLHTGEPTWQTEISPESDLNEAGITLWNSQLQDVWNILAHLPRLGEIAEIHRGIEYKNPFKENRSELVSDIPRPGFVQGLARVTGDFEPYTTNNFVYLNMEAEKMLYEAYKLPWEKPKVIVNAARLSRGGWTIAATIDKEGLVCYQRFHGIWPKNATPLEIIAALLNSSIVNAYISTHRASRDNKIETIKQIPVPQLSPSQMHLIASLVREYVSFRERWRAEPERAEYLEGRCRGIMRQIDEEILDAYDLPLHLEQKLVKYFAGYERPGPVKGVGVDLSSAKRPYTAIIRVENIIGENGNRKIEVVIMNWSPYQTVQLPISLIPENVQEKLDRDVWLLAQVNVGATKAEDLYFENIELAPEPDLDDGLA